MDNEKQQQDGYADTPPALRREIEALEEAADMLSPTYEHKRQLAARAALCAKVEALMDKSYDAGGKRFRHVTRDEIRRALLNEEPEGRRWLT
jgi:hypothetical protein